MMKVRDRIAPVILGLGLWAVGNGLLGAGTARGQEVAGDTKYYTCDPFTFGPTPSGNCIFVLQENRCVGSCSFTSTDVTVCNSYAVKGSTIKCVAPVVKNGAIQHNYSGFCMPDSTFRGYPPLCKCIQGAESGTVAVDGTVCSFPVVAMKDMAKING